MSLPPAKRAAQEDDVGDAVADTATIPEHIFFMVVDPDGNIEAWKIQTSSFPQWLVDLVIASRKPDGIAGNGVYFEGDLPNPLRRSLAIGLGLTEPDPETDSQEVCDSFKLPSENVLPGRTFEGMVIVAQANV
jgi:hypothetical protein